MANGRELSPPVVRRPKKETIMKKIASKGISIGISPDTFAVIEKIAKKKDLPVGALIKLYLGQGLRNDMTQEEQTELARTRLKNRKLNQESIKLDLAA